MPEAEDDQQCDNRQCKEKLESLQRERNELREENQRQKDIIKSWIKSLENLGKSQQIAVTAASLFEYSWDFFWPEDYSTDRLQVV